MSRRLAAALGLVLAPLALASCDSRPRPSAARPPPGPPHTIRVALAHLRWPLDPALADGRDEATVARALHATPLRTEPATGALRPGLCTSWTMAHDGSAWRFRCRHADAIAAELRRVVALRASPAQPLFAAAARIDAPDGSTLVVRLRFPWRRFPYALTVPAAAPRGVPGPFRVVAASPERIVAERAGVRLVFLRRDPHAAAAEFRRGLLDEAPVPLGDLRATRADPVLRSRVYVRPLDGVDLVAFQVSSGQLANLDVTRSVYWRTADRPDYVGLVPEYAAAPAYGLLPGRGAGRATPTLVRSARARVPLLPPVDLPIAVMADPDLVYATEQLSAAWRDLGLGPHPAPTRDFARRLAAGEPDAWFVRLIAPYPQPEALLAALLLPRDGRNPWQAQPSRARRLLLAALAARDETAALGRVDAELAGTAAVVPVAWVAGARLVSGRLAGWRQDALGDVDYARVRIRSRG